MKTHPPPISTSWPLKILSAVLLPLWLIQSLLRSLRDGGWVYLQQRCSFYTATSALGTDQCLGSDTDLSTQQPPANAIHVWIHCASVGEVKTAVPLINQLSEHLGSVWFTVTTLTPTGKELLEQLGGQFAGTTVRHCYLPIDHGWPAKRFLKKFRPDCALIVETEIWPCLYHACNQLQVPLLIVNGRLSQKTERVKKALAGKFIAPLLADALATAKLVLARSSDDANRFADLLTFSRHHPGKVTINAKNASKNISVNLPVIHVCGNLKDLASDDVTPTTPPVAGPYCLLASTHDDEELRLTKAWQTHNRQELLVIVPRHPERGAILQKQLQSVCSHVVLRSQSDQLLADKDTDNPGIWFGNDPVSRKDCIYVADTLGELERFYQHASVVFIGGSLVNIGGHNIYEAARASCAMVVGPHMHNFEVELNVLQQAHAIIQTDTADAVIKQLCMLLDNPQQAQKTGQAAAQTVNVMTDQSDVADSYMKHLLTFIKQQTTSNSI